MPAPSVRMPVTFGVLGPLVAEDERGPVPLPGPRHRAVLARLLIARGRAVPVDRLIDDLWDTPQDGALGTVQTFVGALRKALEPDRPPRTPARLLVTVAPGYAVRAEPDAVDAWRFEAGVTRATRLLAEGRAAAAATGLDEVLSLWRGPAYAEFAGLDWARAEAARLDELRLVALTSRAEAGLALGQAAELVPDLEAQVAGHPLREDGYRLLALAQYRAGRQGDALATLRRARETLRTELGVDPGPALRRLETDVLAQAEHLAGHPGPRSPSADRPARPDPAAAPFVGRTGELADLMAVAAQAEATARPRLVLLSGAAGAGKTALARTLTGRLAETGWITAWGTSPELPGSPAAWPWSRIRAALAPAGVEDDPVAARFHRHRAIGRHLAAVSARGPVLLVFDDLHWADEETLALLTALAADPQIGPVLVVGTYRSTDLSAGLGAALGRAARTEPTRVYLAGLAEAQVRELIQAVTGRQPAPGDSRTIHARSAGNPFFVRELARLWATEGQAGLHSVPIGVRDVIRHRLAGLGEVARTHLRQAAVIGQQVDLDVLNRLAGDEDQVLDTVEAALSAGFLIEPDDGQDGDRVRFAHALVHETVYADVTGPRRARWHADTAEIVEALRPGDVETIAHHLIRAGGRAPAARTAHYAASAAERAEQRFAPHEAARLWRETVAAQERAQGQERGREQGRAGDLRARLAAEMGLVRALAVTGDLQQARRRRAAAVATAEALGDRLLTAEVIGSFAVPALWTANDDEALSADLVAAAERALTGLPAGREAERARLLSTIATERRADAGPRGRETAKEAEAIARRLGDRGLLASALNARFLHTFDRAGLAPERARIGAELLELAAGPGGLVTYQVLGHLILIQAHAALADLATADHHAVAVDRLAERHELPLVGVFTDGYAALRLAVTGRTDEARIAYRAAAARLTGSGMPGLEAGILPLALLCLSATDPNPLNLADLADLADADWGPYQPWARPLIRFAQGEREQALVAAAAVPDSGPDLLLEARAGLHALAAIRSGDRKAMEFLYARLLPASGELAGAGSGLIVIGPVAYLLGELATALGREQQAAGHFRQAATIAAKAQSPHWLSAAEKALHG